MIEWHENEDTEGSNQVFECENLEELDILEIRKIFQITKFVLVSKVGRKSYKQKHEEEALRGDQP